MYAEPRQICEMELFSKIVDSFQLLTVFSKSSILDVCLGPEYVSVYLRNSKLRYSMMVRSTRFERTQARNILCNLLINLIVSCASHTNKYTPCILVGRSTKLSLRKLLSTHKNMMKVNLDNKWKLISRENNQNYARVNVIIHNNLSWSDIFLWHRLIFTGPIFSSFSTFFPWTFFLLRSLQRKCLDLILPNWT